mmetsp:Transcript_26295/g.57597  ORF Transcript_26295/g.57597 Transcript_26295/m.57597 type:complete len:365 (-) Transcript_26295:55-1149(-)
MVQIAKSIKKRLHGTILDDEKILFPLIALLFLGFFAIAQRRGSSEEHFQISTLRSLPFRYDADESCKALPPIRPAGSYFLDNNIFEGTSADGAVPSFGVGSIFKKDKVHWHMAGDVPHFNIIKELLKGKEGGLVFDIGANQGFYTYYLAALGMEVHSFEINENNFKALQHGAEFNPREVSKRVNAYPVGLGKQNMRFGMSGSTYEGFLAENTKGPILGASFDCFAYHMQDNIDLSEVAFVKLDVEGFEISVLQGAQNSLFKHSKVGGFLVEVGPSRWSRSSVDFDTGLVEMKKLAEFFKKSFVLLRKGDTCPVTIIEGIISENKLKVIDQALGVHMIEVEMDQWQPLLKKMETLEYDCNFFYHN